MLQAGGIMAGALALVLAASPAHADEQGSMGMPGGASASKTVHDSVTVTGIDKSARTVTVKNAAGESRVIDVPAEVQSFDKLKKGDKIDIDYTESVALSMLPPGSKPSASEKSAMVGGGGTGAAAVGKRVTVSAEVLEVDAANNKVIFKGPKGNARVVTVENPELQAKLPNLKKGQVVQFTYTEATAVAIQPKK
jgi:hypothetical protein